jgi:methyl-accepting chemotaxis protein
MRALFVKLLPRSLWLQTVFLLILSLVAAAILVGPVARARFQEQFDADFERHGRNLVQTLEKHSDLRLAVTLADKDSALPILTSVAAEDEDVLHVMLLSAKREPFAFAPSTLTSEVLATTVARHFKHESSDTAKFFTQAITREAQGELMGIGGDSGAVMENGRQVLGYVLLGLSADRSRERVMEQTFASVSTSALVLFTVLILFYFRWVARRLFRMGNHARAVAGGDLSQRLDEELNDDIGLLGSALRQMSDSTRAVMQQLYSASQSLSRAANELLQASSRQSENTGVQETSVSEMAAAVSELRETFQQAKNKAEGVIELARRSDESSSKGTHAVNETMAGMDHVRNQVLAISETITGLVDKTNQIDAIIDVVNDLAEQSNVLAINAGIEAAKAGEQGRGFAVVAREVRSLAERSKESTAQVRTILKDIDVAGGEAVRAIDEGTRRTEAGTALTRAAADAIQNLGSAIVASSAAATQIAAATRQQSEGVEQIWRATQDIDRITSESASGVQQLETAARKMNELSTSLGEIVGRHRL